MKIKLLSLLVIFMIILGGCSNNSSELEGQNFKVFSWSPDISPEDVATDNFNLYSALELEFKSSDNVEVKSGAELFKGKYTFENNILSMQLESETNEEALVLSISDVTEHDQNENLYTGTISELKIETGQYNSIGNNFFLGEYIGLHTGR
ncbi:hypothetical protein ACFOU0_08240 [Salinicoccus sesuvii]|uniref:Lipoprotein n=1 Tax=Salinicoccus sesuvii TaxID=868281 RepID=A0ABV7N4N4_9STAP